MGELKVQAGNLTLNVQHRTFGDDGGPALHVLGSSEGQLVQLLRFDCFHKNPHYHYDPDGKNEMWNLDKVIVSDPVGWTIEQVKARLPEMIAAAGYPALARQVDPEAVQKVLGDVEEAMRHP